MANSASMNGKIHLSNCGGLGPSYLLLPKAETNKKCSGRDELCNSVLNNEWVSHPTGGEDTEITNIERTASMKTARCPSHTSAASKAVKMAMHPVSSWYCNHPFHQAQSNMSFPQDGQMPQP
ncbi:hypothetical protein EG327_007712 [Venturia inaequalis]|uniref:Histone deacetylase interacting domain-containing protein n=1 Tax=Venturia inaequalis TaxID=5025 RepID=A0A8H3VS36_VENIN|nr:hypothetical protein EG327_007712 [Venturia inaequalis]